MALFARLGDLKKYLTQTGGCTVDNWIYRWHYQWTAGLLLGCCTIVSLNEIFGSPIECVNNEDSKPFTNKFINTYCWIQSTFSVVSAWDREVGKQIPYPGVDRATPDEPIRYHAYYQWVGLVLFLQAAAFYLPRMIWSQIERGYVQKLRQNLQQIFYKDERKRNEEIQNLIAHFIGSERDPARFRWLHFWYSITEVLNLINVVWQMYAIDWFLGGTFWKYGGDVWRYAVTTEWYQRTDPMVRIFPRLTKCTFRMFGTSGEVEKYDTLCVLSINVVNEKIYIILWFWLVAVTIVTAMALAYRMLIWCCPSVRLVRTKCWTDDEMVARNTVRMLTAGEWFVLGLVLKNVDRVNRHHILNELTRKTTDQELDHLNRHHLNRPKTN